MPKPQIRMVTEMTPQSWRTWQSVTWATLGGCFKIAVWKEHHSL